MNDMPPAASDTIESLLTAQSNHLSLIQSVSHELRSTFGVISGLHSLLPLTSGEAEREDMFNRLHNNTEYATQLFADLEDYCAIENGQMRVEPAPFRPVSAMEYVRKKALPMLQRRKAAVILTGDSEGAVDSDEEKVRRIIKNLTLHLTCVMRVREITIGWERYSSRWVLNVAYHGEPLPDWLFRAETELHSHEKGQHISLLMVRRLALMLDGEIYQVESDGDGRQRFSLQFPH
ncbi:hypothetical protein SAMN04487996_10583 [Dyadobacter soli]|uniref:histidine kinase n=1 Tax=Dyadobacter soli TaxID=659014 RepID=A0A1G7D0Z0_9BACT|nr:HAMP domain-containing sensor histidine kinase [Dyadobacter soli]SDE45143.1 hypothetical protein SAMN04487996_10583 [Dyadobacter soli]